MILSLSHNDLDALGCQLSIMEKFAKSTKIDFYNTNYRDLDEKVYDIIDRLEHNREHVSALIISDVSFSEKQNLLLLIKETVEKFKIKTFFIDHHQYPEDFWSLFDSDYFKVFWNVEKSASLITYETLKCDNKNLKQIIDIINVYDIWEEENKYFKLSQNFNVYFWVTTRLTLMHTFYENNYVMPNDFTKVCNKFITDANNEYNKAKEKKLIFNPQRKVSFSFLDMYFNNFVELELKENNIFVSSNSKGLIRCRFKKENLGGFSDELVNIIKKRILNGSSRGHLHSFSFELEISELNTIMEKFKEIDSIIKTSIKEYKETHGEFEY